MEINWVTTACHSGGCVEIGALGQDWFRIRSTVNPHHAVAITGVELRAFLRAVRAGQFDTIARLEPDTAVHELQAENADLRGRLDELERFAEVTTVALDVAS